VKRLTQIILATLAATSIHAQTLYNEDFPLTPGDLAGRGGWSILGADSTQNVNVISGNLVYPGYSSGSGNHVQLVSGPGGDDIVRIFNDNEIAIGSLYVSFLIKVNVWSTSPGVYPVCLMPGVGEAYTETSDINDVCRLTVFCPLPDTVQFGIQKGSGDGVNDTRGPLFWNLGSPVFLLVIKYDFLARVANLYINPDLTGPEPAPDVANSEGSNFLDLQRVQLRQGDQNGDYDVEIDAIRVFLHWHDAPLPVQLSAFLATRMSPGTVLLSWTTLSETNNYGFFVERRTSGQTDFSSVEGAFIPGHGTTTVPQQYSYTDIGAGTPETAYRLKQQDLDGTVRYSDPVIVQAATGVAAETTPAEFSLRQNYPNPFNPATQISFTVAETGPATVTLYNLLGERLQTLYDGIAEPHREYEVRVDGTSLSSGVYFYELTSGRIRTNRRMMLLR
jgi:hypothetical protein